MLRHSFGPCLGFFVRRNHKYYNHHISHHSAFTAVHVSHPASRSTIMSTNHNDTPLVEIIHLHNCFRGAIRDLQADVTELAGIFEALTASNADSRGCRQTNLDEIKRIRGRVAGRFRVIWSVFAAHSKAEDEFIWPALKKKLSEKKQTSGDLKDTGPAQELLSSSIESHDHSHNHIDQTEYEEDHADEERMFQSLDNLIRQTKEKLTKYDDSGLSRQDMRHTLVALVSSTNTMAQHLMKHLGKEEEHCLPLVKAHLNLQEINDLVGNIMGKRSSETMGQILSLAVENLPIKERTQMVQHMKAAMVGTYFERWLDLGGWLQEISGGTTTNTNAQDVIPSKHQEEPSDGGKRIDADSSSKSVKTEGASMNTNNTSADSSLPSNETEPRTCSDTLTPQKLEKLIRTIAANPELSTSEKTSTIQSLWNTKKRKYTGDLSDSGTSNIGIGNTTLLCDVSNPSSRVVFPLQQKRGIPPSSYYILNKESGNVELVWSRYHTGSITSPHPSVPLFSASELAATYHDGGTSAVLGCPHYSRSCKLRHPSSGRLYTCRLCCDQEREQPTKENDSPLDRYSVAEVLCMRCGALQPAGEKCFNKFCETQARPFAKYFCNICHLYDDAPNKKIYHCPFCNVCRLGSGLGIDFRHCMRCNACVAMSENKSQEHVCIQSKIQGNCPVCYDAMFESTEPLRGLRCGHVMHLNCYNRMYMRGQNQTCPLCKKSIDDMKDHFSLLDSAVRMQPMPQAYASTKSNIYCQDCNKSGCVQYHFVGLKCEFCGSYNTRELERSERFGLQAGT